jgi:chaperone required for assembly of F1-ATPase
VTDALELPRRFYNAVSVGPLDGGHAVLLDGRTPRSPGGQRLILPTPGLAELIAAEWEAQVEVIRLAAMPATRLAYTALEKIGSAHGEVAGEVARYANSDVLCYWAEAPRELVNQQAERWGPLLAWADEALSLKFHRAHGIVHQAQRPETVAGVRALAEAADVFALAGLAHATPLFGSAILALALQRGRLDGEAAFDLSRLDEAYQEQQWGVDEEAAERTARLRAEAAMLEGWFRAL